MVRAYGHDSEIDERLKRLRNGLADTGEKLKSGSFSLQTPPDRNNGCARGRPTFATEAPSPDSQTSRSFTIVTPFAGDACTFVDHIYGLFRLLLDDCIEQDFFDRLTQAAVEYSCYIDTADATAVNLMKILLAEAEAIADDMQTGQFPYASSR